MFAFIAIVALAVYFNKKYVRRAYRYFAHRYFRKEFKKTDFPEDYDIHGIDISHYQDRIDWKKLMAVETYGDTIHFKFVYIKATEGILGGDDTFDYNWEDAKSNHIVRGAYHYFLPGRSARLQAKNFINTVKLEPGDLPPVVDIEETRGKTKAEITAGVKEFMDSLESHYRVQPVIYSNFNFIEDYLLDDFKAYPFWIAHYYKDELVLDDSIHWVFWQHTDKAGLLGINGNTDADVFNGTEEDFNNLRIK